MKDSFVYNGYPAHVIFGYDTSRQLAEEAEALGIQRALILTTAGHKDRAEDIAAHLGKRNAGIYAGAVMHTPVDVTEKAMEIFKSLGADGTVAIGGGSTIGLGKAIALRTDCPQIVVPTTYAGSEMTPYLGQTEDGIKETLTSHKVLPETVIYDISLTHTLPPRLSATSGINAIAHAVESLYAKNTNPIICMMAVEGIRSLRQALPIVMDDPDNQDGRSGALYGAWLCSTVQGLVGMALHHKLCHAIGGTFGLSHSDTHTNVLPHVVAYNYSETTTAMEQLAQALDVIDPITGLFELNQELGIQMSLRELGMPESGIETIVQLVMDTPYWNPRPMNRNEIRKLLKRVWAGLPPMANVDF